MYNPFTSFRITDTWRVGHLAIDYGMNIGTPLPAPSDGVARYGYFTDAGYTVDIVRPDGSFTRYAHGTNHGFPAPHPIRQGELTKMRSGNSGTSSGPHLHTFDVDARGLRKRPFTTGPTLAGGDGTPIITEQEEPMRLIRRADGAPEWSLFHPSLSGPSDLERGYYVITDPAEAVGLARTWADGSGSEKSEPRDVYVGMQAAARKSHENYRRGLPQGSAATVDPAQIAAAVKAALAGDFDKIPTADENGQAARTSIVK